jgi:hypothetical protein
MSILFCHDVKLVTFREFGINGTSYNYDIYMILEREMRSSPGSGTIPRSPLLQDLWTFGKWPRLDFGAEKNGYCLQISFFLRKRRVTRGIVWHC